MLERTLEEAKKERGGLCAVCSISLMDPSQRDHTFCNACWWDLLHHPFKQKWGSTECFSCEEGSDSELHAKINPYKH